MTCKEFVDFLMAYLDGELAPDQRDTFAAHMDVCPSCVDYLQTYEETVRLGKELLGPSEEPVPEDVPEDLVKAVLAARKAESGR